MIRSFGKAHLLAGAVLSASALINCSGDSPKRATGSNIDSAGNVGFALQVPPGSHADTAHYVITGPNSFSLQGNIDVSQSSTVSALIGGFPPGSGYSITVTATSTDGLVSCLGNASFSVASGVTTPVDVALRCHSAPRNGSIIINGTLNLCPTLDLFSAVPNTAVLGSSVALTSVASDLDHVPNPISYHWSEGAAFDATTPNATFVCNSVGVHHITLTIGDSDPGCETVATADVTCTGTPDAGNAGGASGAAGATGGVGGVGGATGGAGGATGGAGGSDGGHIVTVEEVLAAKSSACLSCGQANCATDPGTVAVAFTRTTLGGGAAMALAQCLNDSCDNCFQP